MFKKKKYSMDIKTADKTLQNVFAACDTVPNRVPFDKIVLRNKQNFKSDRAFIFGTGLFFILTFILPLFFPHGNVFMKVDNTQGRPLTVMGSELTENSFSLTFEGDSLDSANSYMLDSQDNKVKASAYFEDTNTIVFPYYPSEYNIYVYDEHGKCIHLLLSPHK